MSWLNGKKTVIGSMMLALAVWLPQLGIQEPWVPTVVQWLGIIGTMFGGTGIIHKQRKGELSAKP